MELRVLNYLLTVANESNITRAAQLLHITQPTLSRQLIQLEQELGVKLFERSSHSVYLTNEGMLLKRRAKEIVSLAEKTQMEFRQFDENLSGVVFVGCAWKTVWLTLVFCSSRRTPQNTNLKTIKL